MGRITSAAEMKNGVSGILVHNTIASTESGLFIGILKQSYHTYEDSTETRGQKNRNQQGVNKRFPIEKKASIRWIDHVETASPLYNKGKQIIRVADREADIYEFLTIVNEQKHDFVIRSQMDRRTFSTYVDDTTISTLEKHLSGHNSAGSVFVKRKINKQCLENHKMEVKFAKVKLKQPQRSVKSQRFPSLSPM